MVRIAKRTNPQSVKDIESSWVEGDRLFVRLQISSRNKAVRYREKVLLKFDKKQAAEVLEALAWKNVVNYPL